MPCLSKEIPILPALHFWWRITWRQTIVALLLALVMLVPLVWGLRERMWSTDFFFPLFFMLPLWFFAILGYTVRLFKKVVWKSPFKMQGVSYHFRVSDKFGRDLSSVGWQQALALYWGVAWRGLLLNLVLEAVGLERDFQQPGLVFGWGLLASYLAILWLFSAPLGNWRIRFRPTELPASSTFSTGLPHAEL